MILIRKKRTKGQNSFSFEKKKEAVFQIKLHKKDEELLKFIQSYFEAGRIEKRGVNASSLTVSSLKQIIEKILPAKRRSGEAAKRRSSFL
jgi:hypothetical protein